MLHVTMPGFGKECLCVCTQPISGMTHKKLGTYTASGEEHRVAKTNFPLYTAMYL